MTQVGEELGPLIDQYQQHQQELLSAISEFKQNVEGSTLQGGSGEGLAWALRQESGELKRGYIIDPDSGPSTIRSRNMPQAVNSAPLRATGIAFAVIIAATACNGPTGNSGGTTTIVTSVVNNGGGGPTTSTPNSKAVNDAKTLCNMWSSHWSQISAAIDDLNRAVDHDHWSWSEPKISTAGDKLEETIQKQTGILKDTVGPQIPQDLKDATQELLKATADYSSVIEQRGSNIEIKSKFDSFVKAEDDFDVACGYKK
jgi:hypothetical protein